MTPCDTTERLKEFISLATTRKIRHSILKLKIEPALFTSFTGLLTLAKLP